MGKRGRNQKKGPQHSKKLKLHNDNEDVDFNKFDDEIDAFNKKRDVISLDINDDDIDSDEEDDEQPIFDYEGIDGDEDEDDDDDDDSNLRGLEAKIVRQQKYLKEKLGDVDDEGDDEEEEQDEKTRKVWSGRKGVYYGAENKDFEIQSSDGDTAAEEEEEVMKLQKERAQSLRAEDYGLEEGDEQDDSDEEPTLGEIMVNGKPKSKASSDKEAELDAVPMYEEVKKDLSALSKDEQMDVVYSSAPELVGLLAELNDATKQLETHINPLLSKVRKGERSKREGLNYLEVKQILLLAYCQAISFYLLLKSEGQPVRDHPVIARLVEIKSLLEKTKELDGHIPDGFEDELIENGDIATAMKPDSNGRELSSNFFATLNDFTGSLTEKRQPSKSKEAVEPVEMQSVEVNDKKRKTIKHKDQPVSLESVKMLQFRAALEEKLKLKAGSVAPKIENSKKQKLKKLDGKLESTGDFDDEVMDLDGTRNKGHTSTLSGKLSQILPSKKNTKKGVSGDDDLPERDDLGERRWKHELRVLARAGVKSKDDDENDHDDKDDIRLENDSEGPGSDNDVEHENELESSEEDDSNDFYNQIKRQRDAKLKLKAEKYSRNPQVQSEAETTVDGKRLITTQMEKNRGLTRTRKKQAKNPRKKYRLQHDKAAKRRKGQVREIRKAKFSYDGEATGINPRISRSTRF